MKVLRTNTSLRGFQHLEGVKDFVEKLFRARIRCVAGQCMDKSEDVYSFVIGYKDINARAIRQYIGLKGRKTSNNYFFDL